MKFFIDFNETKIVAFYEGFTRIKIQKKAYTSLFGVFGEKSLSFLDSLLLSQGVSGLLSCNNFLLNNTSSRYHLINSISTNYLCSLIKEHSIDSDIISKSQFKISDTQLSFLKSIALINFLQSNRLINQHNTFYFTLEGFFQDFCDLAISEDIQNEFFSLRRESNCYYSKNDAYQSFLFGIVSSFSFTEAFAGFIELYDLLSININLSAPLSKKQPEQIKFVVDSASSKLNKMNSILELAKSYNLTLKDSHELN